VQQQARQVLTQQARDTGGANANDKRWEKVIEALIRYLPAQNAVTVRNVMLVLQAIGTVATPALLKQLRVSSEIARIRVIEILRNVRDLNALPGLLPLMSDAARLVQQQAAEALYAYAPESIPGLIDLVFSSPDEVVADSAAQLLERIGEPVVAPIIDVLSQIVPGRTRLLVGVLDRIHDAQCVPALITLLQTPTIDPLLTVVVVRALSHFAEKRVVAPLLVLLAEKNLQISEEAVDALSLLGLLALDDLLSALDEPGEVAAQMKPRVRRAILGMQPFPGERLIEALAVSHDEQTRQILLVLETQGIDAARTMTQHLLHSNADVRDYMYRALSEMPGPVVVPALLDVLDQPVMRNVVYSLLLKFPAAAITPLINLLAEPERGDGAVAILPRFGTVILVPLISALDDQRDAARERGRRVLVALVRQSEDQQVVLSEVIALFNRQPPPRARETLLDVLTNELADIDMPALLSGLEDAHLMQDVADAFLRLSSRDAYRPIVLSKLIEALRVEERRRGAENALVVIGAPAVAPVGELIISPDQKIARSAKNILRDIGVPALPFVWNAHADRSNLVRRGAALEVFHSMRTEVIKDEMVALLLRDNSDDIAMALALLMERIRDEAEQHYADRTMVPELIEYVQSNTIEKANLRIIALLLLLDEQTILDHLLQALDDYPDYRRQLLYILLLLGPETHDAVRAVFEDHTTTPALRAALAAVLGMTSVPDPIPQFAQNISSYGLSPTGSEVLFPDELAVALHALGGLLVAGHWDTEGLQALRNASRDGSPAHELASVLLGIRYSPQIAKLQGELQKARDDHRKETLAFTARILADQNAMNSLKEELEEMRREHGTRGDELDQTKHDKDQLRNDLDKATRERAALRSRLDQMTKERNTLRAELQKTLKEKGATS
jgi:HEAT repeat protein